MALVPEAFDFDEDTQQAVVRPDDEIADVADDRLEEAARNCPERAIEVFNS